MALTLEQLLVQMHGRDMRCVAGFKGLQKEVIGFSILDTPEILKWLKGGEILVSAGYVMKNTPSLIKSIVGDLHRKGCVGLGIKLKRYFDEIPQEIIDRGNELDFPIFEIPYEIRFADLSKEIYMNIFRFNQTSIEQNNHIYQHLIKTVLSDASTEHMLYDISCSIENPLCLTDKQFKLLACEMSKNNKRELDSFVTLEYGKEIFQIKTVEELLEQYRQNSFVASTVEYEKNGFCLTFQVFPTHFNGQNEGFLVIPETVQPLLTEQYELLDIITPLIGIQLFKERSKDEAKASRSSFINNVLLNMRATEEEIRYYCELEGMDYRAYCVCVSLKVTDYPLLPYEKRKTIDAAILMALKNELGKTSFTYRILKYQDITSCFMFAEKRNMKNELMNDIIELCQNIRKNLQSNNIFSEIGVSTVASGGKGIVQAFRQSVDMLNLGRKVDSGQQIHSYNKLQVYHMLQKNMTAEQMNIMYEETIKVLDDYDKTHQSDLLYSLERYIENKFNLSKTAEEIHVHRNTLINKMEKIKEVLGRDLDNSEEMLKIELGIRIKRILF